VGRCRIAPPSLHVRQRMLQDAASQAGLLVGVYRLGGLAFECIFEDKVGIGPTEGLVQRHVGQAPRPRAETILVLLSACIGAVADSLPVAADWVRYASGTVVPGTAPVWLVAMWMLFATTLNVSLRWLRRYPLAAIALGAVGGPLADWAGARLGAMRFVAPVAATVALAIGWAVLTPLLVGLARRFDGCAPAGATDPPRETSECRSRRSLRTPPPPSPSRPSNRTRGSGRAPRPPARSA
jgi:hypothetical protein